MSFVYTHKLATSAESINDFQTTGIRREINPRVGGPKETRMNRVRLMYTGRYCEAAIARGEKIEDVDAVSQTWKCTFQKQEIQDQELC